MLAIIILSAFVLLLALAAAFLLVALCRTLKGKCSSQPELQTEQTSGADVEIAVSEEDDEDDEDTDVKTVDTDGEGEAVSQQTDECECLRQQISELQRAMKEQDERDSKIITALREELEQLHAQAVINDTTDDKGSAQDAVDNGEGSLDEQIDLLWLRIEELGREKMGISSEVGGVADELRSACGSDSADYLNAKIEEAYRRLYRAIGVDG